MKFLLDTNIFVYLVENNYKQLSANQKEIIGNPENELFISEATYYELSIKSRLIKQANSIFNIKELDNYRKILNIKVLKSNTDYYIGITDVPKVYLSANKLHGDPFDLLIISQALTENLTILSSDSLFPEYDGLNVIS